MKILQHNGLHTLFSCEVRNRCYRNCSDLIVSEILDDVIFTAYWNPVERIVQSNLMVVIFLDINNEK